MGNVSPPDGERQPSPLQRLPESGDSRQPLTDKRYEAPTREWSQGTLRAAFLDAVAEVEPEVLRDLEAACLGAFHTAAQGFAPEGEIASRYVFLNYSAYPLLNPQPSVRMQWSSSLLVLRDKLFDWARRWSLDFPWCLDTALRTLDHRAFSPMPEPGWHHARFTPYGTPLGLDEQQSAFEYYPWNPLRASRTQARKDLIRAFTEHLDAELDRIEAVTEERGFVKAPEKRNRDHAIWLALFVVKGRSYSAIAHEKNSDRQTVTEAIASMGKLIALPDFAPDTLTE